jgi:hypothetical protein
MRVAARFPNVAVQGTKTAIRKVPGFLLLDVSIASHWLSFLSSGPKPTRIAAIVRAANKPAARLRTTLLAPGLVLAAFHAATA